MNDMDTEGLILLVQALSRKCECERRLENTYAQCHHAPLSRWWIPFVTGNHALEEAS